jgi:glutaredoxin-related protein
LTIKIVPIFTRGTKEIEECGFSQKKNEDKKTDIEKEGDDSNDKEEKEEVFISEERIG